MASKKKKKQQEPESYISSSGVAVSYGKGSAGASSSSFLAPAKPKANSLFDIAPVRNAFASVVSGKDEEEEEEKERTWFSKGLFDDGYDIGDISKSVFGTAKDLETNLVTGVLGMGEKAVDLGAYVLGGAGGLLGADKFQDKMQGFIEKDLYDEEAWAERLAPKIFGKGMEIPQYMINKFGGDADTQSILGEKSDSLVQSAGQLGATVGLQAVGVPWWLTTGTTSFGGEAENALKQGATYGQAGGSALITASADILTEKLFGGSGLGEKGLIDVSKFTKGISNKLVKTLFDYGIDVVGEGGEEVVASIVSKFGDAIYKDESFWELATSEEAVDEYLESFVGGAVLGGGMNSVNAVQSVKSGRDYRTGLSVNEEKVVAKEVENRVAELETDEKKLSEKEKKAIEEQVIKDLDRGYISIDTIESTLGGETYNTYKSITEQETALQEEFDTLNKMKQGEMTGEQIDRRTELKNQLEELKKNSNKTQIKEQLGLEVQELVKTDRLTESYNEKARRSQSFEADLSRYDTKQQEVVKKAQESGILNNTNRTHEFVDWIAKISADKGVSFDFTNNQKLKESGFAIEGKNVNGYVKDGNVVLNIQSSKALDTVVGHEITHVLEGTELYTELQNAVKEYATTKGVYDTRLQELTKLYEGVEGVNIENELTADLVGDYLFTDSDFVSKLSMEKPNVFKKIYDEIKYLVKTVTGSKEARQLEKVKKTFEKAYKDSSSNGKTLSKDVVYSMFVDENIKQKAEQFKKEGYKNFERLKVIDITDNIVEDVKSLVGFDASGYEIYANTDTFKHIEKRHGENGKHDQSMSDMRDVALMGYVLENYDSAELVYKDGKPDVSYGFSNADGTPSKKIKFSKKIDGVQHVVVATPENKYKKLWVISEYVEKIKKDTSQTSHGNEALPPTPEAHPDNVSSKDIISESQEKSTSLTEEQKEYFKDSVVRDENGNLKVMYHGTSKGGHTVFDPYGKANYGLFGVGTYFTDNKSVAESYTEKGKGNSKQVYETYLNITNPIDMDAQGNYDAWHKALPDADFPQEGTNEDFYRAMEEYLQDNEYAKWEASEIALEVIESMGYDGVTHIGGGRFNKADDTRHRVYIAFSPEQIKNIDNAKPTTNADIRYSLSDSNGKPLTEKQQRYFKNVSQLLKDENGNIKRYYHGTARGDRVGTLFDPDRATSGPMAFFTDNPEIAESYSKNKADTSIAYDSDYDSYETQFRVKIGDRDMSLIDAWRYLPMDARKRIKDRAEHTHYDWDDYETLVYDEDTTDAGGGFQWQLRESKNNVFRALNEQWLNSGNLFGNEADYIDVLKFVGVHEEFKKLGYDEPYYKDPDFRDEKVFEVYLNISNPFDTSTVDEEFLEDARDYVDNTDLSIYESENADADMWDKHNIDAYEWLDRLERDIENGTTHAWTSIPDVITDFLKDYGRYDGIVDTGGKRTGYGHQVVIPFYSEQIKNIDNDNPTADPHIDMSLSDQNQSIAPKGRFFGKDMALETAPVQESLPVEENSLPINEKGLPIQDVADEYAPLTEQEANERDALQSDRLRTLDENYMPDEVDAPYYESEPIEVESPFDEKDIREVGNQKQKAYMYENPEVKPYFQEEAQIMLGELRNTIKGERVIDAQTLYDTNGEFGIWGTKRETSEQIAYLKDNFNYSYEQIEKGLNAIIEDNGKENNAVSKRIEFMIDERLREGYTDFTSGYDMPPNQEYIDFLAEKQITQYSDEAYNQWLDTLAQEYASQEAMQDDIAPIKEGVELSQESVETEQGYEAIEPAPQKLDALEEQWAKNKMSRVDTKVKGETEEQQIARILTEEPKTQSDRNRRKWAIFKANVFDKGMVFEDLALKTKNRELMGKWNYTLYSEARAQRLMGEGAEGVKSLNDIRAEVENTGLTKEFYEYLYHKHNVDRMKLAERYEGMENKPVFGYNVTAEVSQDIVDQYEFAQPNFMDYAQDVYNYNNHLRQLLVDKGVISQETADLWSNMYPHYVPIRRVDSAGLNVNVPLDTGRTGVNAPIKKATGGNTDILPLFDTMASRTIQTYKATAKNSFGVELKNTLGTTVEKTATNVDEMIESIDTQESLLQEGKNGQRPTFTVFENGERVTFEITEDMYDAFKPLSDSSMLNKTIKPLNVASNFHRGLLTEYNPVFMITNGIKDIQDVLINSQHSVKTYLKIPEAHLQALTKGHWYKEYMDNGGEQNSYFDSDTNTFKTENKGIAKLLDVPPLSTISKLNNYIEVIPRLAEYIASRESGRSIEVSMLDSARVTTNFRAGGDFTKFLNRNGATFLNASVQGAMQQVRNVREAKMNGIKGWANLATKFAVAGLPAVLLNHLLWDDDEEYEELSDYVKQNYYVVAKTDDGQFIRIPKGRTLAVIQEAFTQMENLVTGNDEADLKSFLDLVVTNLSPNNPIENNVLSPIVQVMNNKTWYGEDLVPSRLADLPAKEQFDESTDLFSKWLGEKLDISPVKINYLLDQYSGGVGDVVLPMLTPEAESGDDTLVGNLLAPLKKKFTTDSVMNNQNVSDFYETSDKLTTEAKKKGASDKDVLSNKYLNSVKAEMGELYGQKRDIQNSNMSAKTKYARVREIQKQIDELAKEGLSNYKNVRIDGNYATVGDRHYRLDDEDGWKKLTDDQLEKQNEVTNALNISPGSYWNNKEEYDYAYERPNKYALSKAVGGYDAFRSYSSDLYDIKADKDSNGKSINGSRKAKVIDYINNLDASYEEKIILFKSEYNADDTYNYEIIEYLNNREDISYEEEVSILIELGFTVDANGNVYW